MKCIIITADGPEHRAVTKSLVQALGSNLVGVVFEQGGDDIGLAASLKKAYTRYGLFGFIERLVTKVNRKLLRMDERQAQALHQVLGTLSPGDYLPATLPTLSVASANKAECIAWIEQLDPDYIFVYGTGIIGKKVLALPKKQALNLHTGISPYYRGSDCAFWPLYQGEPHMVGATVHKCTAEIDGGDIYGRVSAKLEPGDDAYIAFARAVEVGASLYAHLAAALAGGEEAACEKQDYSLGTEFRFKDKTFVQDLIMEYRVRSGKVASQVSSAGPLPFDNPGVGQ